MRFCVIGGDGFVGSGFVRCLEKKGLSVTVINRSNYNQLIGTEYDVLINANGNSKKFLAKDDPKADFQASVASVRNSLVDFKFKTYVFLSTSDVYPDCSKPYLTREDAILNVAEQSPYGFHRYLAELCVRHGAEEWLIIRQGGFVGPGIKKNAVYDVLYGSKLWVHPDSRFQFIRTDDSARLVIELIDCGVSNEVFNLTGRGTISVREVMNMAGRIVPHDPDARPVHYEIATDKVSKYLSLPDTHDAIREFLVGGKD